MLADRQQQRDPNSDRRRATDKYRFSREVRTGVDEEQIRQTDQAGVHVGNPNASDWLSMRVELSTGEIK
ncbi:hypothetical protein Tco_0597473 [Tanacetum coccineum]